MLRNSSQCDRIDAFFKLARKFKELFIASALLTESDSTVYRKIHCCEHCVHKLLPHNKSTNYRLRNSDMFSLVASLTCARPQLVSD